jgi:hypothetical protein
LVFIILVISYLNRRYDEDHENEELKEVEVEMQNLHRQLVSKNSHGNDRDME